MIATYGNDTTRDIHYSDDTKDARKVPKDTWSAARRKLNAIMAATRLGDLSGRGNHLEKLKGKLDGWHSIRINEQWRIIFKFPDNAHAEDVTIVDYH